MFTKPVLGCHSDLSRQYGDVVLGHVTSVGVVDEGPTLPNPVPMVTTSWQVVEGVKLGGEEGELLGGVGCVWGGRTGMYYSFLSQSCRVSCSCLPWNHR